MLIVNIVSIFFLLTTSMQALLAMNAPGIEVKPDLVGVSFCASQDKKYLNCLMAPNGSEGSLSNNKRAILWLDSQVVHGLREGANKVYLVKFQDKQRNRGTTKLWIGEFILYLRDKEIWYPLVPSNEPLPGEVANAKHNFKVLSQFAQLFYPKPYALKDTHHRAANLDGLLLGLQLPGSKATLPLLLTSPMMLKKTIGEVAVQASLGRALEKSKNEMSTYKYVFSLGKEIKLFSTEIAESNLRYEGVETNMLRYIKLDEPINLKKKTSTTYHQVTRALIESPAPLRPTPPQYFYGQNFLYPPALSSPNFYPLLAYPQCPLQAKPQNTLNEKSDIIFSQALTIDSVDNSGSKDLDLTFISADPPSISPPIIKIEPIDNIENTAARELISRKRIEEVFSSINTRINRNNNKQKCVDNSLRFLYWINNQKDLPSQSLSRGHRSIEQIPENMSCEDKFAVLTNKKDIAKMQSKTVRFNIEDGSTEPVDITFDAVVFQEEGTFKTLSEYIEKIPLKNIPRVSGAFRVGLIYLLSSELDNVGHMINFYRVKYGSVDQCYLVDAQNGEVKTLDYFILTQLKNYENYLYIYYDKGENLPPIEALKNYIKLEDDKEPF